MFSLLLFCSVQAAPEQEPNGQQIAVGQCEHADVILGGGTTPKADTSEAEPVIFGKDGEGIESLGDAATTQMVLTQSNFGAILRMAATADEHGVPLLMRLGETQSHVVYHSGHRSIPGSWATAETDFPQGEPPSTKKTPSTIRRTTPTKTIQCKVKVCSCRRLTNTPISSRILTVTCGTT